ncbi:uncharacterized protein LOC132295899 [Cornus florida]|uniref:uncharacterized protein LOC132295899 n=1 Tax=Cornus florida TaxID=4283 RepID=UPI0028989D92|nr:uncharacterized protein LOC132295899 [Cornus florida]
MNCKQNHKSKEKEEASTFTCEICTEVMLPTSTKKFKNNNRCVHSICNSICTDCIAEYIIVGIEENNPNFGYPSLFCRQMLDPLSCRHVIPAQLFNQWCDMLCDSALLRLDACYCPYQDCSALILNECGGDVRRSECPNCDGLFCFRCKQPWHAGYECEDHHQSGSSGDVEFRVLEESNEWMRCPLCKHCVELVEDVESVSATNVEERRIIYDICAKAT